MIDEKPKITQDEMFQLLRQEKIYEFNTRRENGENPSMSGLNFRGINLRGANINGLDFSNSTLRLTDLRGNNMQNCNLEGASIKGAHISGVYFPQQLSAQEIMMSQQFGTRMRYKT
ncbi:MAG: pentapeptide repeat-containing protein [Candidatus Cloacimonetes bacterium]|nr:pentapeptide repeat-containing protein [Candidatus Cloacimonadota bacterium]